MVKKTPKKLPKKTSKALLSKGFVILSFLVENGLFLYFWAYFVPYLYLCKNWYVGSVSVPATLALGLAEGRIKAGDRVALLGIGSGLASMMLAVECQ